jgi:hypothetical protein
MTIATRKTRRGFDRATARIIDGIQELADGINAGILSVDQWQVEMANLLAVGHTAAWMEGADRREIGPIARSEIQQALADQLDYLNAFADELDTVPWSERDAWYRARANLYAGAMRSTYSKGRTLGLPLPAHPGDGSTRCLVNCKCEWRIQQVGTNDDYDCYWRLGSAEHCPDCVSRSRRWAPFRIRGGEAA